MRAVVVHAAGRAPAFGDHPDPVAGAGQTLVRVTAVPVVPLDLLCASGTSYFGEPACPYVPGVQGVGVVEQSDVIDTGTRVWFSTSAGMRPGDGGMAELCVVPDVDVVPIAAEPDDTTVASLGLSAIAAWMCLTWKARLQPGETVIALGAGGAVGQSAIGAAQVLGAGRVVAVCRPGPSLERARQAGADHVVAFTEDTDALTAALREATGGSADVVVDPVFGTAATAAACVLGEHGRLVNLGGSSSDSAAFSSAILRSGSLEVLGYTNNSLSPEQRRAALTAILEHAAAGHIRVAHETWPLDRAEEAWARQASGEVDGRLVLVP
ncbi:MAG: zinc-binding alcohol dehydrogenase family protein [Marmoricola sp.]